MSAAANSPHRVRIRDATLSGRIATSFSDLIRFRHLVWYMAVSSLAVESRGTKLGRTWWIIEPLLLMGVYTVFVRVMLHRGGPHFPLFVLAAILSFEFFARSTARSMSMLKTAQSSMLHVAFPRTVIPLGVTLSETIRFIISLGAFILIAAPFGVMPTPTIFLAIPFVVAEILFTLGAAYFLSATGVFFRDLSKITEYLLWLLFHLAPGMYALRMIPAQYRGIFYVNPFTTFFQGIRTPLLYGRAPQLPLMLMGIVSLVSVLVCVGGYLYFLQREGSFNKVVL